MHKFLRAVGFTDLRKKDIEEIVNEIIDKPDMIRAAMDSEGNEFAELSKEYASNIGITVCGTYEEDDTFVVDYYYPYMRGTSITTHEQIEIEKHAEKESYAGVCDDVNLGVTLIFYLQNITDYMMERAGGTDYNAKGAVLSGLSVEGKIILPIQKRPDYNRKRSYLKQNERNQLIAKAREGNEDAIENLTLEDMDMYTLLAKRIENEDVLSIVDSCFMPYGIESDQYSIIGEIIDCFETKNSKTNEVIYAMKIQCNNLNFDICINQKDLLGEPAVGRRFKGNIWMQGYAMLQ